MSPRAGPGRHQHNVVTPSSLPELEALMQYLGLGGVTEAHSDHSDHHHHHSLGERANHQGAMALATPNSSSNVWDTVSNLWAIVTGRAGVPRACPGP